MASTTKIMTALVVLDHADFGETITISAAAEAVGDAEIDLRAGQRVSVDTLFEAMLVPSANDAAYALAEYVAGTIPAFAQLMNEKARALGLQHSAFTNPTGLDADGHYTCASDLATLAAVAMTHERFAETVALSEVTVEHASGAERTYPSTNQLLRNDYEGIVGVKTGHTRAAGWCFVGAAERDGVGLTAVVLGTGSDAARFAEAQALLDWGFEHYALQQVSSAEATAALVPVGDYLDVTVPAVVAESVSVPVFDLDGEVTARADVLSSVEAPVVAGQRLGTLTVRQGDRLLAQVPLVAGSGVVAPGAVESVGIWFTRLWRTVFGGAVAAEPVLMM
jgi:D-alanyl-D-alanine carboxypeptidase